MAVVNDEEQKRLRQQRALERAAGSWKDEDHPDIREKGTQRWVMELRAGEESAARRASSKGLNIRVSMEEIISAIKELDEEDREFFVENLLAMLGKDYKQSIKEARADYKAGRALRHAELFK